MALGSTPRRTTGRWTPARTRRGAGMRPADPVPAQPRRAAPDAGALRGGVSGAAARVRRRDRWAFPARNRIIAALAGLSIVVEAAERSGLLITADIAITLGRDVGAVPGSPLSWRCSGPTSCCARARPSSATRWTRSTAWRAAWAGGFGRRVAAACATFRPGCRSDLRTLLDAIQRGADAVDDHAGTAAEVRTVLGDLTELELLGLVQRRPGGRYAPVARRPARPMLARDDVPAQDPSSASTIAVLIPGAGAGIQADLKAFARAGVHGTTAITAITAQNTVEVTRVEAGESRDDRCAGPRRRGGPRRGRREDRDDRVRREAPRRWRARSICSRPARRSSWTR